MTSPSDIHRRRSSRTGGAFTLVELLLVLLIVALTTSIAVPMFRRPGSAHQARVAAAELVLLCREARGEARRTGRDHAVRLVVSPRRIVADLRSRDAAGAVVRPARPAVPVRTSAAVTCTIDGRTLTAGDEALLWFTPAGPAADGLIRLGAGAAWAPRVTINARSGLIRLIPDGRTTDPPASRLEDLWEARCRTF